jgi:hypothetical protein
VRDLHIRAAARLGPPEVEAIRRSLGGSLASLSFSYCTLLDSFWVSLAQHFTDLKHLCIDDNVQASATDISMYLAMRSQHATQPLSVTISEGVLDREALLGLHASLNAWGLQNTDLYILFAESDTVEEEEEQSEEHGSDQG